MKTRILFILAFATSLSCLQAKKNTPNLVVIIVIDQFAYHYIKNLSENFKYGFKRLLDKGICYHDAHHPHGAPTTAVGHTTLSTGAVAKDHGITLNRWIDEKNRKIIFGKDATGMQDDDTLLPEMSSDLILVDTISDVLVRSGKPQAPNYAIALSHKARAAIAMAGKLGKALWFDAPNTRFISSATYWQKLPNWVHNFNQTIAQTYKTTTAKEILNSSELNDDDLGDDNNITNFLRTPPANQMLLSLAQACLNEYFHAESKGKFLLWVSLSSLDMIGHTYGPQSPQVIDMIMQLDKQLDNFITFCQKKAGRKQVLFVLTADHGVAPNPETLQEKGFDLAQRILTKPLIKEMNTCIKEKYGIEKVIKGFKANQFFLNKEAIPSTLHTKILQDLKQILMSKPGIKQVWTQEELNRSYYSSKDIEIFFKNQFYAPRSGDLICMPNPYCFLSKHETGTSHRTPYDYDTHVPLIFYRDKVLKPQKIYKRVWTPQVAATIACLCEIPKPSAARYNQLPGL